MIRKRALWVELQHSHDSGVSGHRRHGSLPAVLPTEAAKTQSSPHGRTVRECAECAEAHGEFGSFNAELAPQGPQTRWPISRGRMGLDSGERLHQGNASAHVKSQSYRLWGMLSP